MTDPSKMNDAELRLAIAEELGYKQCSCGKFHIGTFQSSVDAPNWPSDIMAALGLLDECDDFHLTIQKHNEKYRAHLTVACIGYDSSRNKSLARTISEVWYKSHTEKRQRRSLT
ncbi:unnamed protein product [marine sediment metagenome]|uniref:Uncharacterized protein n=1 Tax=marine sediment metagenome TaxID=412755 RepID=X1NNZ7_9ZZZZ